MKKQVVAVVITILVILVGVMAFGLNSFGLKEMFNRTTYDNPEINIIKQSGVLRVGLDATYFPMEFLNDNEVIDGYDLDLAKEIAKEIGVTLKPVNVAFDNLFDELNDGKLDLIISSITITTERSKKFEFSKPYFNAGQVAVVLSNNNTIKSVSDLKDKRIGVQSGTTSETAAKNLIETGMVVKFADYDLATVDLVSGKIDAMVLDYPAAVGKAKKDVRLTVIGKPFTQEFYGVVAKKANVQLLQPVNAVIFRLLSTDGQKKLESKWLQ